MGPPSLTAGSPTLVLFDVTKGFQISDAVSMKDTPAHQGNDPYGVAYGDGAFYVAVAGYAQPGELIRVAQGTP